jgi:hypothetical protein
VDDDWDDWDGGLMMVMQGWWMMVGWKMVSERAFVTVCLRCFNVESKVPDLMYPHTVEVRTYLELAKDSRSQICAC